MATRATIWIICPASNGHKGVLRFSSVRTPFCFCNQALCNKARLVQGIAVKLMLVKEGHGPRAAYVVFHVIAIMH